MNFNHIFWNSKVGMKQIKDEFEHTYYFINSCPIVAWSDLPTYLWSEDLADILKSMILILFTLHIVFYVYFISAAVYLPFVLSANYYEHLGSNSSNFEAMNIQAAPINWNFDFVKLYYFDIYKSTKFIAMWNVYFNNKFYLSFHRKLVTYMHHPFEKNDSHHPAKMSLVSLNIVRGNLIIMLSVI